MIETLKAKITVLSPVHIGSGREDLLADYDFIPDGQFVRVVDHEKMFEEASEDAWQGADVDVRISQLLTREQYEVCSRYSLKHPGGTVNKIVEHIKNAHCRPYIPGSSLKGAIRTALAFTMVTDGVIQVQARDIGSNPRSAANSIEARLFGTDPNHDMMRSLQVADTPGVETEDSLVLNNVVLYSVKGERPDGRRVFSPKEPKPGFTFLMEMIPSDAELELSLKLDGHLLRDDISRRLGFDARKGWLIQFPKHCNTFAQTMIDLELQFYTKCGLPRVKSFYERLNREIAGIDQERQFLLQMAWGTGWSTKTVGEALPPGVLNEAIKRFHLGKKGYHIFPKTRRLVERGNVPEMPPGWIRIDLL